jgi:hypothetical protein
LQTEVRDQNQQDLYKVLVIGQSGKFVDAIPPAVETPEDAGGDCQLNMFIIDIGEISDATAQEGL